MLENGCCDTDFGLLEADMVSRTTHTSDRVSNSFVVVRFVTAIV